MKAAYLVDLSSLIFRAFYAVRPLHSSDGTPVNAVYGVVSMIFKLLKEQKPDLVVFCQDQKTPSFRKELFAEYKANRSEMPEDLIPQMEIISEVILKLGFPLIGEQGFEADDVIGTLALQLLKKDYQKVFIVSGDKDFSQLVTEQILIFDTMKEKTIGPQEVFEKFGVRPDQFKDYLGLVGDSSDNIPGVKGVGPKTAASLLSQFKTLDHLLTHLDQVEKLSLREKLAAHSESARLSRQLASIALDVPLQEELWQAHRQALIPEVLALFEKLNFKSFPKQFLDLVQQGFFKNSEQASLDSDPQTEKANTAGGANQINVLSSTAPAASNFSLVSTYNLEELKTSLLEHKEFWIGETATTLFFGVNNRVYNLDVLHSDLRPQFFEWLFIQEFSYKGYNLKKLFHKWNFPKAQISEDLQLGLYLLHPGDKLNLELLAPRLIGRFVSDLPESQELVTIYSELSLKLQALLKEQGVYDLWKNLENPLAEVLFQMEKKGFALDRDVLEKMNLSLSQDIAKVTEQIHQLAGEPFNVASPKQLGPILFDKLGLPPSKKTKTGYSTDSSVLESLENAHPIVPLLLKHREWTKLKSTYVEALPKLMDAQGRVHSEFQQALTTTGRLSSIEPNLQNIPIRTERGAQIREAFVAAPGLALLSADYSQIELRILAHLSQDKGMLQAFRSDLDIHQATAAEIFSVKLNEVTPEQRRAAKAVNFGIAYGQGAFGLADNLKISRSEASEIIKSYFKKFKEIQDYFTSVLEKGRETGYVETILKRRRYLPDLQSGAPALRKLAERAAINAPMQGSAADIVKLAMLGVASIPEVSLILQVHDELIFEGPRDVLEEVKPEIIRRMESVYSLQAPLKVNASIGSNWKIAH